jgi:hypothetical protein
MDSPPTDHPRAFLAHAEKFVGVRKFATRFAADLRVLGVETYLARENPRPDEIIPHMLGTEIERSHGLIVVWTKSAYDSEWVKGEIAYARKIGRHVCLIRYGRTPLPPGWEQHRAWLPMKGVTFPSGVWAGTGPWLGPNYGRWTLRETARTMYRWAGMTPRRPF